MPSKFLNQCRLSPKGLRLLFACNHTYGLTYLAERVDQARKPVSLEKEFEQIEALGVDRMMVAVFGSVVTSRKLGVDLDLADCLREASPEVIGCNRLRLTGDLDLRGFNDITVPWVEVIDGWLFADRCKHLTMPSLQFAGALFARGTEDLSLPSLQAVSWAFLAGGSTGLVCPALLAL